MKPITPLEVLPVTTYDRVRPLLRQTIDRNPGRPGYGGFTRNAAFSAIPEFASYNCLRYTQVAFEYLKHAYMNLRYRQGFLPHNAYLCGV